MTAISLLLENSREPHTRQPQGVLLSLNQMGAKCLKTLRQQAIIISSSCSVVRNLV